MRSVCVGKRPRNETLWGAGAVFIVARGAILVRYRERRTEHLPGVYGIPDAVVFLLQEMSSLRGAREHGRVGVLHPSSARLC